MSVYFKFLLISFLIHLSLTLGYCAEIQKAVYIIGGGGEPLGNETIFDTALTNMGNFFNKSDWFPTISFNGLHPHTEDLLKTIFKKARNLGSFDNKNYNDIVSEMIKKVSSGDIKEGSQLMLIIDTHGARNIGEKTHQIYLNNASTVNLDRLKDLISIAEKKGVKLAVVDMSCFSGNIQNLKNDKVCLISGTGKDQFGYGGVSQEVFTNKFYSLMNKGKNLEDIFLSARTSGDKVDFPTISTPEGKLIDSLLYKFMAPFLDYNDEKISNYTNSYGHTSKSFEAQVCLLNKNLNQMQTILAQMENFIGVADKLNKEKFKKLRIALENYRDYQKQYESSLRGKYQIDEEIKKILEKSYPKEKKVWKKFTLSDWINADFSALLNNYITLSANEKNPIQRNHWNDALVLLQKEKEMADYVKSNLSEFSKQKLLVHSSFSSGVTEGYASDVAREAKAVYDILYKQMKWSKTNPCRDFVL